MTDIKPTEEQIAWARETLNVRTQYGIISANPADWDYLAHRLAEREAGRGEYRVSIDKQLRSDGAPELIPVAHTPTAREDKVTAEMVEAARETCATFGQRGHLRASKPSVAMTKAMLVAALNRTAKEG